MLRGYIGTHQAAKKTDVMPNNLCKIPLLSICPDAINHKKLNAIVMLLLTQLYVYYDIWFGMEKKGRVFNVKLFK